MCPFFAKWRQAFLLILSILAGVRTIHASEVDALTISLNIQQLHMPYGTVLDPVFASSDPASPGYSEVRGYTRAGDSAIWTGHYLAAEAFRYQVTRSPDALANAWKALGEFTGIRHRARTSLPVTSRSE